MYRRPLLRPRSALNPRRSPPSVSVQDNQWSSDYSTALAAANSAVSPLCLAALPSYLEAPFRNALPASQIPEAISTEGDEDGDGDGMKGLLQLAGLVGVSARKALYDNKVTSTPALDLPPSSGPDPIALCSSAQTLVLLKQHGSASGLLGGLVLASLRIPQAGSRAPGPVMAEASAGSSGLGGSGVSGVSGGSSGSSGVFPDRTVGEAEATSAVSAGDVPEGPEVLPIMQGLMGRLDDRGAIRYNTTTRKGLRDRSADGAETGSLPRRSDGAQLPASTFLSTGVSGGIFAGCCDPTCINLDKMSESGLDLKPYELLNSRWV